MDGCDPSSPVKRLFRDSTNHDERSEGRHGPRVIHSLPAVPPLPPMTRQDPAGRREVLSSLSSAHASHPAMMLPPLTCGTRATLSSSGCTQTVLGVRVAHRSFRISRVPETLPRCSLVTRPLCTRPERSNNKLIRNKRFLLRMPVRTKSLRTAARDTDHAHVPG